MKALLQLLGVLLLMLPASFMNPTFLNEIKKSGFIDKLYKQ